MYDYFGCTWAGDGGLEPQIDRLNGQLGSWAAGWSEKYMYGSTGPDHYPDFISANGGTIVFRCQGNLGRLVTHESGGASNWWTVHSTFVFGAIIDAQSTHTKAQLMGQIIGHMTPVELASFEAIGTSDGVRLIWQTQCEEDNIGFLVHRSFHDEVQRVCISTELIPGAGTTAMPHSYSYLDPIRTPGRYSYWLEQLDAGGGTEFHGPAVAVVAPLEVTLAGPYPNPASETVRLDLAIPPGTQAELALYDARGHLVETVVRDAIGEGGRITVTWAPHAAIAPGLYRWRLTAGGHQAEATMIIAR